jgi:hypothetical protein
MLGRLYQCADHRRLNQVSAYPSFDFLASLHNVGVACHERSMVVIIAKLMCFSGCLAEPISLFAVSRPLAKP